MGGSHANSMFNLLRKHLLIFYTLDSLHPSPVLMHIHPFMAFVPMSPPSPFTLAALRQRVDMGDNPKSHLGARSDVPWSWNTRGMRRGAGAAGRCQNTGLSFSVIGSSHCGCREPRGEGTLPELEER